MMLIARWWITKFQNVRTDHNNKVYYLPSLIDEVLKPVSILRLQTHTHTPSLQQEVFMGLSALVILSGTKHFQHFMCCRKSAGYYSSLLYVKQLLLIKVEKLLMIHSEKYNQTPKAFFTNSADLGDTSVLRHLDLSGSCLCVSVFNALSTSIHVRT